MKIEKKKMSDAKKVEKMKLEEKLKADNAKARGKLDSDNAKAVEKEREKCFKAFEKEKEKAKASGNWMQVPINGNGTTAVGRKAAEIRAKGPRTNKRTKTNADHSV